MGPENYVITFHNHNHIKKKKVYIAQEIKFEEKWTWQRTPRRKFSQTKGQQSHLPKLATGLHGRIPVIVHSLYHNLQIQAFAHLTVVRSLPTTNYNLCPRTWVLPFLVFFYLLTPFWFPSKTRSKPTMYFIFHQLMEL